MTTKTKTKPAPTGLTLSEERELVRQAYENFPEAAQSFGLSAFKYGTKKEPERFHFEFVDYEDNSRTHVVKLADAVRGLRVFAELVRAGKLRGLSLPAHFLSPADDFEVLGDWDGPCFDALAQCAIFGEVIYG